MYHFRAESSPVPVRLNLRGFVSGYVRQYLKPFQIEAIKFMDKSLSRREFCCYNDESGLGKQAAVAVLIDVVCSGKKTLIVVENDDKYVHGWQFHFSVLTKTSVTVITGNKDSTNTYHNVYIAKWSTLKAIDDLTKFKFDFIILDNRGQMLNNSFCTSMLFKHYEKKINIVISSVDITSDLKLMHNILKLGGQLEPRYAYFKVFEEKFKLPSAKDIAYKNIDLEDYFLKRERLVNYCKSYRLRRYCHQYEFFLPLVPDGHYNINLNIWREKQSATNSEGSSVEVTAQQIASNERERGPPAYFEAYCKERRKIEEREKLQKEKDIQRQKEEEEIKQQQDKERLQKEKEQETEVEIIYNVDDEVASINDALPGMVSQPLASRPDTDEVVHMSPLLVVSDSEDLNDEPQICNDPSDLRNVVNLSSEDEGNNKEHEKSNYKINQNCAKDTEISQKTTTEENVRKVIKRKSKINEVDKLKADVATNLQFQNKTTLKKRTSREEEILSSTNTGRSTNPSQAEKKLTATGSNVKKNTKVEQHEQQKSPKTSDTVKNIGKDIQSNNKQIQGEKRNESENLRPRRLTRCNTSLSIQDNKQSKNPPQTKTNDNIIKIEDDDEPVSQSKKYTKIKMMKLDRIKRELDVDHVPLHHMGTRSMQRLTRSHNPNSKYSFSTLSLHNDRTTPKTNKNPHEKPKSSVVKQTKQLRNNNKSTGQVKDTQASIISLTCSQDNELIQCAQRLSDAVNMSEDTGQKNSSEFLVPPTPAAIAQNSLIPLSFTSSNGFFKESEVIFVPPSAPKVSKAPAAKKQNEDVIILSESETECGSSMHMPSTSRRTKALKPQRMLKASDGTSNKVATCTLALDDNNRKSTKSPDLFSNCSDLGQLTLSQLNVNNEDEPMAPFEGFKIFGSEVKQMQQHYASAKTQNSTNVRKKPFKDQRSCLDILENMFEPKNKKAKSKDSNTTLTTNANKESKKSTRTPIVPHHPIEAIAEAKARKEIKEKRSTNLNDDEIFETTNNGTFGNVMRINSNGQISPVQQTQKNPNIANKITKYFMGNSLTQTDSCNGSQEDSCNNSESGTSSNKPQQQISRTQYVNSKKSPKQRCPLTQTTKLTKWFTKNSPNNKQQQEKMNSDAATPAKRQGSRRKLNLSDDTKSS